MVSHNHLSICGKRSGWEDMRKIMACLFFFYCVILAEILFLSRTPEASFGRLEYMLSYSNVCPFGTVVRYISFFLKHRDLGSFCLALKNIGGNFILFMPMGFFLPVLFSHLRHFRKSLFAILQLVLLVEFFQGFFRVGIPDIDDLIVNAAGACVGILMGKNFRESCHRTPFVRIHFE